MTPLQFTRNVRSLNRLRQIAKVLTQEGFGHIVARMNLYRFVPVWMIRKKFRAHPVDGHPASIGRRIARVCTELGPTFIKLGQMLSTRPDLVPADVLAELRTLQDDVPPFDTSEAMTILAGELGRPIDECFASINQTPIASGSIGQVYRATMPDGTPVVVKIRRPHIEEIIRLDMQLLAWLAASLESMMPELRIYRPTTIIHELGEMLTRELDFVNEGAMTSRFEAAFREDVGMAIPKVFWKHSGSKVLTLEALPGKNIHELLSLPADCPSLNRPLVARRLAEAYLKQVFELGVFHADPHPGNILIEAPATVGLIDFGQVGTIPDELMTQLLVVLYGAVHHEIDVVVDALADLGALGQDTDRRELHRTLQQLLGKYYGLPLKRLDLTTLVSEFSDVVRRHDVVIPREVFMLFKALALVHGVGLRLDPELDLLALLRPRLQQAMRERLSPPRVARAAGLWGWQLFNVARLAPFQLREGLRRLSTGTWRLNVRHENIERFIHELDRSSNRLAFSVVIAAIIVGSSVVVSADTALTVFGFKVQYLGIVGYLLAAFLGLGLSWAIFRSGRLH